ncbi:hypothetical protein BDR26DRAFT_361258 [Obelidium mucronatum]|nr:hypothetical protein BDR26DRAFT_361258 [Obelidium mucronatum]
MLSKKESISPESRDTKASKTTTIHRLNSRYRPQFFLLIVALLATCTVTVGVLGWQLTLGAAKGNIESLVQEMQDLVSNHISSYIREESMILQEITALQAKMFAADNWSLSTPERTNATLKNMLILLNTFKAHTMDMFYYTYPGGLNFGYYYPPEVPGQLRLVPY